MHLDGKVAVITGGSGGIGAATAALFAQQGARVVIGYKTGEARAKALAESLPGAGHLIQRMVHEEPATLRDAARYVQDACGRADILVNSAGFTKPIPHHDLEALDDELFDALMVANVRGPFSTIRSFAPLLKQSGDGLIVNVSSISAFTGSGSNIAYCASKAALDTMTLSLARALGPELRVLTVSPAAVATDFVAGRGPAELQKVAERTPLKRIVEPEDVARAILACATHLTVVTGSRIVVDGGRFLAT